jgi:prolyl-tRNA editing enzyme YbaK/EbsC (Cys-tRNA(Pro) deacylase)
VKEVMGCEIGACYPLGELVGIKTVVDLSLLKSGEISFNPGVHDRTIKLKTADYLTVARGEVVDIAE